MDQNRGKENDGRSDSYAPVRNRVEPRVLMRHVTDSQ